MEAHLMELGFSKNEAKTYLALTEIGSATATRIAERAKIHRTNVYEALERLISRGLASFAIIEDVKHYQATDPENLLRQVQLLEARAREIIPALKVREQLASSEGIATIHKGVSAFVNLLYNQLRFCETIKVYGIPRQAVEMMRTQIPHFHEERLRKKIAMWHIYNYDAIDRIRFLNKMPHTKARYIADQFRSQASTLICGDEVITTLWNTPVFSVRIVNAAIADSYRHNFDVLWKQAVSP